MISQNGINFIKKYEGCVLHPYLDSAGKPTIGWGMRYYPDTGKEVTMQDATLTQAQADAYFLKRVKTYYDGVLAAVNVPLNTNQIDALTSFAYNCGVGAFQQSVLRTHVNQKCVTEGDFTAYDHAGGKIDAVLLSRRKAEYALFSLPVHIETTMDVTPQTPKVLKIKSITVTYDEFENDQTIATDHPVTVNVTPDLVTALSKPEAGLILEGFNITVV